ncbi:MAG TPA: DUF1499 domain-containing protein, partial [Kiloniellales bacterium]|nr:DUF1499 domain-containing protein [Kiloniellales bacterium]
GHRLGLWSWQTGFSILRWAAYLGIAVAAVALIATLVSLAARAWRWLLASLVALALGAGTFAVPALQLQQAQNAPPIHDITTDIEDPPGYVALLERRASASNPPVYGGEPVAAQQRRAYPEIGPISYRLPPDQVFERVLQVVRDMGLEVVAAEPGSGRIEAVATSFWFGFKDDVVIRIRRDGAGSVIDIRSSSREGIGDLGVNAARIKEFTRRVIEGSRPAEGGG